MRSRAVHTRQRCGREPVAVLFFLTGQQVLRGAPKIHMDSSSALQVSGRQGPGPSRTWKYGYSPCKIGEIMDESTW